MSSLRVVTAEELRGRINTWETIRLPRAAAHFSPHYNAYCEVVDGLRRELKEIEQGGQVFYRAFTAQDVLSKEAGSEELQALVFSIGRSICHNQRLTTGQTLGSIKKRRQPEKEASHE